MHTSNTSTTDVEMNLNVDVTYFLFYLHQVLSNPYTNLFSIYYPTSSALLYIIHTITFNSYCLILLSIYMKTIYKILTAGGF